MESKIQLQKELAESFIIMWIKLGYTIIFILLMIIGYQLAQVYDIICNHMLWFVYNYIITKGINFNLINFLVDIPLGLIELFYASYCVYKILWQKVLSTYFFKTDL